MLYDTVSENINSNTNYEIYNDAGTDGIVEEGESIPDGAEVIASNVPGSEIDEKARSVSEGRLDDMTSTSQSTQEQEQQMSAQYYDYLTGGESSSGDLCER